MRSRSSALAFLAGAALACGAEPAPAPPQPIPFSHKVHAGENRIGCTACHVYAERGPVAGIPSMQRCHGCHKFVSRGKPPVEAFLAAYEGGRIIEWIRVHRLPDHVYFTHERHLATGVRCQECHGAVETMDVVRQVSPLSMGWCLECHERKRASRDCLACHR